MADTPTYWRFSKEDVAKFGEALRLLGGVPVAPRALLIEDFDTLRGQILDLVANELLTVQAATDEIIRLLHHQDGHTHWFIQAAAGERCEKCGLLRAAAGEGEE